MNIAFFITPKEELVYINENSTMRQAMERMEYHRYNVVPLIDDDGKYAGSLTEGDMLWALKNSNAKTIQESEKIKIKDIEKSRVYETVPITESIDALVDLAKTQNFVPVVDDAGYFIGIITRSHMINYCFDIIAGRDPYKTTVKDKTMVVNG